MDRDIARIRLVSDLHLEFDGGLALEPGDEDVLVVAGDISPDPTQAWAWLGRYRADNPSVPVVVVLGNHDYYGRPMAETDAAWAEWARQADSVHVLADSTVEIAGIRFFGATMWTDMTGSEAALVSGLADFSHIHGATVDGLRRVHRASANALAAEVDRDDVTPLVVVTHHLPNWASIDRRYRDSPINGGFASTDLDHLVAAADLWLHGHTHSSIDTVTCGTRIVCNPRGYVEGRPENPAFNPDLVVEF